MGSPREGQVDLGTKKNVLASKAISSYKTPRGTEDKLTATNKQSQDNVGGHGENRIAKTTKKKKREKNSALSPQMK